MGFGRQLGSNDIFENVAQDEAAALPTAQTGDALQAAVAFSMPEPEKNLHRSNQYEKVTPKASTLAEV